jgi:RNA ligase
MALDFDKINKEVANGFIAVQRHPVAPYRILNYTQKAQYEWHWTPETRQCRGLILDDQNNIVARPFEKFFSYEQLNGQVPIEPFGVYEKMDGSLGVLYWFDGQPYIATRGSFVSPQATWATNWFRQNYWHFNFLRDKTYLFEIIYHDNRVVVDYGDEEGLWLLTVIDTATGKEETDHFEDGEIFGLLRAPRYDGYHDLSEILQMNRKNAEGFVLRFIPSNTRVKVKHVEYKRLHRLLTGVNERHVWESLMKKEDLEPLLERVPDEYLDWFRGIETKLKSQYADIEAAAKQDFQPLGDRKSTAEVFHQRPNPHILFAILDGKDYSEMIWKMIRPEGGKTFRCDTDS